MEDIKKRKEKNDKGKGQNGNEKKKDECEKILDNVVKELVEQMKEAPDKQVDEFTRAFAPFHTSNGLNNLALENSLSNCREVCEERCLLSAGLTQLTIVNNIYYILNGMRYFFRIYFNGLS